MRLVVISDTHGLHHKRLLPSGDILIVCGDFSNTGSPKEIAQFITWLGEQEFKHRIVIVNWLRSIRTLLR